MPVLSVVDLQALCGLWAFAHAVPSAWNTTFCSPGPVLQNSAGTSFQRSPLSPGLCVPLFCPPALYTSTDAWLHSTWQLIFLSPINRMYILGRQKSILVMLVSALTGMSQASNIQVRNEWWKLWSRGQHTVACAPAFPSRCLPLQASVACSGHWAHDSVSCYRHHLTGSLASVLSLPSPFLTLLPSDSVMWSVSVLPTVFFLSLIENIFIYVHYRTFEKYR